MSNSDIFNITDIEHPSLSVVKHACENWKRYLEGFCTSFPETELPYRDNEMSAIGSLSSGITRFAAESYVILEAAVPKNGNRSTYGRCDLLAYIKHDSNEHEGLCFEAKRNRKEIKVEELENVFSKNEKENINVRSLIGKGLRDISKTTGNKYRLRINSKKYTNVMLLMTQVKLSDKIKEDITKIKTTLKKVFSGKVIIRTGNDNNISLSKKYIGRFATIGFIYVPDIISEPDDERVALVATMTLL